MFVQIGHLFLQLWGFDVGIWHSHHHHAPVITCAQKKKTFSIIYFIQDTTAPHAHELHAPAQVIREIYALAHFSSDYREQQRSREPAAVQSTPLTKRKRDMRVSLIMNVLSRGPMFE